MKQKIGVFDSGVGGLTVVREIQKRLPQLSLIYFGDTARAPYGNRSKEELEAFGREIISFLLTREAELLVVACNTSSANVLAELQNASSVPLIGMIEAAVALAGRTAPYGKVGLLATQATVQSGAFERAVEVWNDRLQERSARPKGEASKLNLVISQACPDFVPLVEAGLAESPEAYRAAANYCEALRAAQVNAVILGCTHYPFLHKALRAALPGIMFIDPAQEVALHVEKALGLPAVPRRELKKTAFPATSRIEYYVSGEVELFCRVGNLFMEGKLKPDCVHQKKW